MLISCSQHIYTTGFTVQTHSIKRAPSNPSHTSTANKGSSQASIYQRLYFATHCFKQKKKEWILPLCACNLGRLYVRNAWILQRLSICSIINRWIPNPKQQPSCQRQTKEQQGLLSGKKKCCHTSAVWSRPTLSFGVTQISRAVVTQSRKNAQQQVLDYSHRCSTQIFRWDANLAFKNRRKLKIKE